MNADELAVGPLGSVEDGFGASVDLCMEGCAVEVVRPGKFQCPRCDWPFDPTMDAIR